MDNAECPPIPIEILNFIIDGEFGLFKQSVNEDHEENLPHSASLHEEKDDEEKSAKYYQELLSYMKENDVEKIIELQSNNEWLLLEAVIRGNLEIVKFFISRGYPLEHNYGDPESRTLLNFASYFGHIEIANFLLDEGADIESPSSYFTGTALEEATIGNHIDMIILLLDRGADLDGIRFAELFDNDPVRYDIIELLLSKGANIDGPSTPTEIKTPNGEVPTLFVSPGKDTPLYTAVNWLEIDVITFILDKGANIELECKGLKPLTAASRYADSLEKVELLIDRGADILSVSSNGFTPLLGAVYNSLDIFKFLVNRGANIEDREKYGRTSLFIASDRGKFDIVEFLISEGAIVDVKTNDGWTPLIAAAQKNHLNIVEILVDSGADIEFCNDDWNPLFFAISEGNFSIVKFLINKGSNIEIQDGNKNTPLLIASKYRYREIIEFLVDNGADIYAKDKDGKDFIELLPSNLKNEI